MAKRFLIVIALIFLYSGMSRAEGIQTLIAAGKNMGDIQKALNEETDRYERVKAAIESGRLKKGASKYDIIAEYGEPVIENMDNIKNREKLVYMPATSSFFKGPKIYLYFDVNNILDEIAVVSQ
ncbi:MAG TPA: hypothetical protein PLV52_00745 [Candidatus Omnitrophota bacterium]|nr:hypothetical protein [Candidatus Omnitrophota bacterium]